MKTVQLNSPEVSTNKIDFSASNVAESYNVLQSKIQCNTDTVNNRLLNSLGWWYSGCGQINLNGMNANEQLNIPTNFQQLPPAIPYQGIVWYPFLSSTSERGKNIEVEGGSWATFKATEMKIFTIIENSKLVFSNA